MSLLAFDGVTGARGERVLFRDLSFTLDAGEALAVTGPNGAGKSTLLRIAAGLLKPAAGRVSRGDRVAFLGEPSALDGDRSLAAALAFWSGIDGTRDRTGSALDAMDLDSLSEVPVRFLSTGQRRRAALARVIASDAALWLLDEPANGLDAAAVERLAHAIAAHRAAGGAVLVATHLPLALPGQRMLQLGAGE